MNDAGDIRERMRAESLADEEFQRALTACATADDLAAVIAMRLAVETGRAAALVEQAGRGQNAPPDWTFASAPPRQWLPVQIFADGEGAKVEWVHFGFAPLVEPFFEQSLARAMALPASALLRCATPLETLLEFASERPPEGLIFHMSRCGSTLVAQMLGALEGSAVVAEAPVLDQAIQLHLAGQFPAELVRGLTGALLRDRAGDTRHLFVKLDAWHTLALPRIAALFPSSRWAFLFRDPVEVLVSQARKPGMHVTPGAIPFELFGLRGGEGVSPPNYPAWVIGAIARAGLGAAGLDRGLLVEYADLPGAVTRAILPHFGVEPGEGDTERLAEAGARYSKQPHRAFAEDRAEKQGAADTELRARAETMGLIATHSALRRASKQSGGVTPNEFRLVRSSIPIRRVAVNFRWDG